MSNTILTTDTGNIAKVAASLVGLDSGGLAPLVMRHLEAEFEGGRGATIRVKVPGAVPARTRSAGDKTTAIVSDEISEQAISVALDDFVHSSVILSEKDMSLDLTSYATQVLSPQCAAISRKGEALLAEAFAATPLNTAITYDRDKPYRAVVAARRVLRDNGVSAESQIVGVAGTNVYEALLGAEGGFGFDPGTTKVRGIELRESNRLGANDLFVFVKEAFTLVFVAPTMPEGATRGASVQTESGAVRALQDYDSSVAADRSLVGALVAAQAMPLAVVDETAGTVALVPNAGVVRMSIADAEPVA
ncbi:hypothetical protein [Ornithinimicrobium sp. W1665]|uniref:hypothetical protein n=1 Tax=Ornithinimicrobium sp. W1665 TaxID=3416666 RepID=UPI003CFA5301